MQVRSYASGPSSRPLRGETIGECLDETASRFGDRVAVVSRHQVARRSWAELHDDVETAARGLLGLGIATGDRVGIWSPSRLEWVVTQLAAAKVGAILVNVNPAYRPAELAYALRQSGTRMLVAPPRSKASDYLAAIAEARRDLPDLERVVVLATVEAGDAAGGEATGHPGDMGWDDLLAAASEVVPDALAERAKTLDPDDPINIQYTSGTTGSPKGATLTHHNILNNGASAADVLGYTELDAVCIPVPLYHCFGSVVGSLACLCVGATMVFPASTFDALATLEAIAEERCTSIYGVPTMFIGMLEHPRFSAFDTTSLRTGVMAGAPCPIELMKRTVTEMHVAELTIAYGMTETSPVSTMTLRSDDLARRTSTVGTPLPHVEVKIADPASRSTVERGVPGEICARGYLVMEGYWNDPDATSAAIDSAGWMHTGDLGVMDADGYINVVGRSKDLVIRGGENIYPREIEEVLFGHPAVAAAQVIGVPDARLGEEVMAWITWRDGAGASEDELRSYCQERLAHFKVPRYWKVVDEFPMTVTGKVQKFKMREMAIAELALEEAAAIRTA